MRKLWKRVVVCFLIAAGIWCGGILADRQQLNEQLIRLHVVANSDSREDQAVKLQVRDVVTQYIQQDLSKALSVEEAKAYLQENLPKLQQVANGVLQAAGFEEQAVVSLCQEAFDTRVYDTFTLPAGVYDALRITIGAGEGHNWWCVVFPSLCVPATAGGFAETAVEAGFSEPLTGALTGSQPYEVRFYALDALGRLENYFHRD